MIAFLRYRVNKPSVENTHTYTHTQTIASVLVLCLRQGINNGDSEFQLPISRRSL